MTLTRKLVSVAYSALLFISYSVCNAQTTSALDPTQVYNTGNIVQPTVSGSGTTPWVNGVYQDNLTCWAWGNPGYCGPNPIVRPGNNINFSYGLTNLYQIQSVAGALPDSGSGLRVNGYNFSFTAKNGNGWDDGRLDYLTAYVSFYDPKGSTVFNKNYDLNSKFNWTSFNYSENFNTPFASKDLGSVQYGFVGRDNNFWAGPYGPEIYNVSFSLKYSVDPCFANVLSSPSCPGYLDALAKLSPTSTTSTEPVITTTSTGVLVNATPTTTNTTTAVIDPVVAAPAPTTTTASSTPTANLVSYPVVSATPSATNPQPKIGEVQTSTAPASTQKSTVSMSQILSIVAGEQSRISNVEKTVVQEAVQQAIVAGASATAQAESVAAQAQAQSIASSNIQQSSGTGGQTGGDQRVQNQNSSIALQGNNPTSLSSMTAANFNRMQSAETQQQVSQQSSVQNVTNTGMPQQLQIQRPQDTVTSSLLPVIPQFNIRSQESYVVSVYTPQANYSLAPQRNLQTANDLQLRNDTIKFGERNIIDMATQRQQLEDSSSRQQVGPAVKKDVKDNEAAGNVTLASIARQPVGFESYFGMISDAKFYEPKEIYKNQKVVDNVRLLRGLTGGSDRLHEQMIEQQYKLGN